MRQLREFLARHRRRIAVGVAVAVVVTGVVIIAPTTSTPTVSLAASTSSSGTRTCSWTTDTSGDLNVTCTPTPAPTTTTLPPTTTTQPPATTTTLPPTTTTTQPSTTSALLGLWNNGTSASSLGVTEQVVSDYSYGSGSCTYGASGAQAAAGKLLFLHVGACTTAQDVAIANLLKANGQSNAVILPMWEMNQGTWFSGWNESTLTVAAYKADWVSTVNAFRSVAGTSFRFDYDLTAGSNNNASGRSNFDSWPGNAYVDFIGIDVYDYGTIASLQASITADANEATILGLPMTFPEWGLVNNVDDPAFVNLVSANCKASCYEQALFSGLSSGAGTSILKTPNSLSAYRADFG